MKKLAGISLIVSGIILFSFCVYQVINYMTVMEQIKAYIAKNELDHFVQGVRNGKIAIVVLLLISIGLLLKGYKMNKKAPSLISETR